MHRNNSEAVLRNVAHLSHSPNLAAYTISRTLKHSTDFYQRVQLWKIRTLASEKTENLYGIVNL
jgi:hypothetical protein